MMMSRIPLLKTGSWRRFVVAAVALSLLVPAAASPAAAAGGTSVSIAPADASVEVGQSTTFEVVVDNAQDGVGAAEVGITIDGNVAKITEAEVLGSGATNTNIADDGSSVDVEYAFRDTVDTGSVTIVEVTVAGVSDGTTDVSLEPAAGNDGVLIFDEAGTGYDVTGTNDATLSVAGEEPAPAPADFQVSDLDAPDSATQGDAIDVSADVTNDGGQEATQSVVFGVDTDDDGKLESLTSEDVTLGVDETQTISFEDIDTSGLDDGEYTHGVSTANDSEIATITIEEPAPASFQVSNLEAPETVTQGDAIEVSADIENTGGEAATQAVEFRVDGTTLATKDVELDSGESTTVTFEDIDTSDLESEEYTHGVFTENDSATATLTVEDAGLSPIGDFANSPNDPDGDGLYEDVNGDGTVDIVDVQALFANLEDETVQNNPDNFDFNQDGEVDVVDVQRLYNEVLD